MAAGGYWRGRVRVKGGGGGRVQGYFKVNKYQTKEIDRFVWPQSLV